MSEKKPPPKPPAPAAPAPKKPGFFDRLIGGSVEKGKQDPLGLKGSLARREKEAGLAKGGKVKSKPTKKAAPFPAFLKGPKK